MANDFDCSIDYLVNEAMRYYARSKNYQSPGAAGNGPPGMTQGAPVVPPSNTQGPTTYPPPSAKPNGRPAPGTQPPPNMAPNRGRVQPATPGYQGGAGAMSARSGAPTAGNGGGMGVHNQPPPAAGHAPVPASVPTSAGSGGSGPTLFLIYNGQRYPVTKDQFIIGRGSKTSDLPIKDGNISRKHAAVIRRNGTFYIKDLGSTNGIDYKGMRIDNKRIDEGDVFHLCDYELRFTYRAD
ncbi:MAG TPA: FHA domain-containing protein [Kofleriaceae bacterium]|nr:FHA domain-containing protein [Kofleriaceae bacterium]